MRPPEIALLHATRGREEQLHKCLDWCIAAHSEHCVEHVISFDGDCDEERERYDRFTKIAKERSTRDYQIRTVLGLPANLNRAWDRAFLNSSADIVVQLADDVELPKDFDRILVERIGRTDRRVVLGVADPHGHGGYMGTGHLAHLVCTRFHVEECGYFMHPELPAYGDTDATRKAVAFDVLVDAYDVHFVHHWHGGTNDPLRDSTYAYEERVFPKPAKGTKDQVYADWALAAWPDVDWCSSNRVEMWWPPDVEPAERNALAKRRLARSRDWWVAVEPIRGTWREAYLRGRWIEAIEKIRRLREKVSNYCGGRMNTAGLDIVEAYCEARK